MTKAAGCRRWVKVLCASGAAQGIHPLGLTSLGTLPDNTVLFRTILGHSPGG